MFRLMKQCGVELDRCVGVTSPSAAPPKKRASHAHTHTLSLTHTPTVTTNQTQLQRPRPRNSPIHPSIHPSFHPSMPSFLPPSMPRTLEQRTQAGRNLGASGLRRWYRPIMEECLARRRESYW